MKSPAVILILVFMYVAVTWGFIVMVAARIVRLFI
jgi:hypothetical protein